MEQSIMDARQEAKLINAVSFLASEHRKRTKTNLCKTALFKYLAFFETRMFKETGRPPIGLTYTAMDYGPVPDELFRHGEKYWKTKQYFFKKRDPEGRYVEIISTGNPDMSVFSKWESDELKDIIEIFANRLVAATMMSDASHQDIKSWKKAWNRGKDNRTRMLLSEEFDNLETKTELEPAEESFLVMQAITGKRI